MINTLIDKIEFNNGCVVELHDYSNWFNNKYEYLAQIATLSWGKSESKDAKALWERLKTESGGKPSSVFEFLCAFDTKGDFINMRTFLETDKENRIPMIACPEIVYSNVFTFKIKVPIYIMRQLIRHRRASYNEISFRRIKSGIEFHIPQRLANYHDEVLNINKQCLLVYDSLIERGIKPELARTVLPTNTYTTVWIQYTNNEDSWHNLIKLRTDHHTQEETREVVINMRELVNKHIEVV